MSSPFVLLHLPQCVCVEIIGLNGVSTSLIGFQRFAPLGETVKTPGETALRRLTERRVELMRRDELYFIHDVNAFRRYKSDIDADKLMLKSSVINYPRS